MSFSGAEVSNKGFPRGWGGEQRNPDDQAAQRVFRVTQLLEAFVWHQWAWNPFASMGLKYAYIGGVIDDGDSWEVIPNGTVTLANNATNYVERSSGGTVSVNQSGFTYALIPMAEVVTKQGRIAINGVTDRRPQVSGSGGSGAGATNFTQLSGQILNNQVPLSAVQQHQGSLAIAFTQLIGSIAPGQVPQAAVTQYADALAPLVASPIEKILSNALLR